MKMRGFGVKSGRFPAGAYVPAGPQDSSVRDAGHSGHWAQRVIEASPVQNRMRQDGGTGHCYCFLASSLLYNFSLKTARVKGWSSSHSVRGASDVHLQGHSIA